MKRVLALVTVLSLLIPSVAIASPADESSKTPTLASTLKAQGMQAAAEHARLTAAATPARDRTAAPSTPAPAQNGRRSFWKTPWPYVIIGAVVVVAVIAAKGGYGNGEGSGY